MPLILSSLSLVAANLIPLAGLIWFEWQAIDVLSLYWAECVVITGLTAIKIIFAQGRARPGHHMHAVIALTEMPKLLTLMVFAALYACFLLGYLVILQQKLSTTLIFPAHIQLAAIAFLLSHGISMAYHYFYHREYQVTAAGNLVFKPFLRLIPMQLTIVIIINVATDPSATSTAIALLIFKPLIDLATHAATHIGLEKKIA